MATLTGDRISITRECLTMFRDAKINIVKGNERSGKRQRQATSICSVRGTGDRWRNVSAYLPHSLNGVDRDILLLPSDRLSVLESDTWPLDRQNDVDDVDGQD